MWGWGFYLKQVIQWFCVFNEALDYQYAFLISKTQTGWRHCSHWHLFLIKKSFLLYFKSWSGNLWFAVPPKSWAEHLCPWPHWKGSQGSSMEVLSPEGPGLWPHSRKHRPLVFAWWRWCVTMIFALKCLIRLRLKFRPFWNDWGELRVKKLNA